MTRAKELIRLLYLSAGSIDGNEDRNHITGLEHSLRVATLASRHDPHDTEMVFVALVHDLARPLSDIYHGEVIAEIVRDMVSTNRYHVLKTHGQYQAGYIHNTRLSPILYNAPWHPEAKMLCAWEVASFKKDWPHVTMTIEEGIDVIDVICGQRS